MAGGRHVIRCEDQDLCVYEGDAVPRVDEGLNITVHDGGGKATVQTYVVVEVTWSVHRWNDTREAHRPAAAVIHVQPI